MIYVYNRNVEDFSMLENNYYIGRENILSNPYTHLPVKDTKAMYQCKSREEAIDKYSDYFDLMYGRNAEFTKVVDEMYEKYKNGEDLFLECYCAPQPCHGDIIAKKLQQRFIKEKYRERNARK